MKILVASQNPVKINAIKQAFTAHFNPVDVQGMSAPSGVPDQPLTDADTLLGAQNRLAFIRQQPADYYAAIEGGVDHFTYGPATFAYVLLSNGQHTSVGRSAQLPLPNSIYQALLNGEELGNVMDHLFQQNNVKQAGGAIGLLTNGKNSRTQAYTQAAGLALAPFLHPARYP